MNLKSLPMVPLDLMPSASRRSGQFGDAGADSDTIDTGDATGGAPLFLVKLKHGKGSGGYRLTITLEPRADVVEAFRRHRLTAIEVYTDTERERAIENWQASLREEKHRGYRTDPDLLGFNTRYFLSPAWVWTTARQAYAAHQHGKVLRISVGNLLDGSTLTGSLEWLHAMERELLGKVDWLASRIAHGVAFDGEEIAIYAPGKARTTPSPDDGGTPPNEWRP